MSSGHTPLQRQAIALAGVFQAAVCVDELARTGHCNTAARDALIKATVDANPPSFEAIYGDDLTHLRTGIDTAQRMLTHTPADSQIMRYMLSIQLLANRARKSGQLMADVGERLERVTQQAEHFGATHENVVLSLGEVYKETLSTLRYRVVIKGDPDILRSPHMPERVRALLLCGIRFALLWREQGGHRWQLLLQRTRIKQTLAALQ